MTAFAAVQNEENSQPLFGRFPALWWALVVIFFAVGLGIRLFDLTDAPLDFQGTRQLHSAFIARGMYYQNAPGVPQWQRDLAVVQWHGEGMIEPQVLETVVAWTYRLAGGAYLWIPRLYSIFFWTLGGIALLMLTIDLIGKDGALVAVLFYMVWPYGAIASRSFQPDPLMVALIIWALWALERWDRNPNWRWTIAAGVLAGAAIYIKSVAVFFLVPAIAAYFLFGRGLLKSILSPKVWVLSLLAVVPYGIYYIDGIYIHKFLVDQMALRFFPQLWTQPVFYLQWNGELSSVVSMEFFLTAVVGVFLIRRKAFRAAMVATFIGYLIYGLALSHNISTHDYYSLPLIPMVALGLGSVADLIFRNLRAPAWIVIPVVIGVLFYSMTIKAWDVIVTLKRTDYSGEIAFWEKMGKTIPEGSKVVGLVQDYGYRLSYWGWIIPTNWMASGDFAVRELAGQSFDMKSVFAETTAGKDYFLVTMFGELDHQPALKSILEKDYPIYLQGDDYVIYDLQHPLQP